MLHLWFFIPAKAFVTMGFWCFPPFGPSPFGHSPEHSVSLAAVDTSVATHRVVSPLDGAVGGPTLHILMVQHVQVVFILVVGGGGGGGGRGGDGEPRVVISASLSSSSESSARMSSSPTSSASIKMHIL